MAFKYGIMTWNGSQFVPVVDTYGRPQVWTSKTDMMNQFIDTYGNRKLYPYIQPENPNNPIVNDTFTDPEPDPIP
jgi:hypothetical protein